MTSPFRAMFLHTHQERVPPCHSPLPCHLLHLAIWQFDHSAIWAPLPLRPGGTTGGSHGWSQCFVGATRGTRITIGECPGGAQEAGHRHCRQGRDASRSRAIESVLRLRCPKPTRPRSTRRAPLIPSSSQRDDLLHASLSGRNAFPKKTHHFAN